MHLRPEDVQDIVSLLDSLAQDEFELRTSELHVTLRRAGRDGWTQESRVLAEPNVVAADALPDGTLPDGTLPAGAARDDTGGGPEGPGGGANDVRPGLTGIRAPLPGTFYRAPKPGADPYVEVGSRVEEDTVVGLLETMKLFNSVHANVRGEIVEFLIDDAEPADQDAVLILVRPDAESLAEG